MIEVGDVWTVHVKGRGGQAEEVNCNVISTYGGFRVYNPKTRRVVSVIETRFIALVSKASGGVGDFTEWLEQFVEDTHKAPANDVTLAVHNTSNTILQEFYKRVMRR